MRLFLSHSGTDTHRASELKKRMEAAPAAQQIGLRIWLDVDDLNPGRGWQEQLEQAVEEADAFAVLIGGAGVINWVDREVRLGLERATGPGAIPFVPIRDTANIEWEALPPFARQFHGITDPVGDETALASLIAAVTGSAREKVVLTDEPFVGLRAMDEAEADRFFGRDEEVVELAAKVRAHSIVAVVADSGAGKSSLVRAGLIPAYRGGVLADEDRRLQDRVRHVVVMRPGSDPLQGLRDGIDRAARGIGRSASERRNLRLSVDPRNPAETGYALRADLEPDTTDVLLVVDQFEELLTQANAADADQFVGLLTALADPAGGLDIRVVLTVRADYYNLIRRHEALFAALEANDGTAQLRLKRISEAGLADVVHRSLAMAGHADADERDALLAAITRDTTDRPGDLALIQMALYATWRHARRGGIGLMRAYSDVHGVLGALAFEAERVRGELLSDAERDLLLPLFARLITLGDTGGITRRGATLEELGEARGALAQRLATEEAGRLLMITDDTVEVAHEALVAQWPWLQEQIQTHAAEIRTLSALGDRCDVWQVANRRSGALPNASEHTAFTALAAERPDWPSSGEMLLIRRTRRRRVMLGASMICAVVAIVAAAGLAVFFAIDARKQTDIAEAALIQAERALAEATNAKNIADEARVEAEVERLRASINAASAYTALAQIERNFSRGSAVRAAKLALAAWPKTEDGPDNRPPEVASLLSNLIPRLERQEWVRNSWRPGEMSAEFSNDGRYLYVQSGPGTALLIDVEQDFREVGAYETFPYTRSAGFSLDGKWFAATHARGSWALRDLRTGEEEEARQNAGVTAVGFSPDSKTFLYAVGSTIYLRELGTENPSIRRISGGRIGRIQHMALSDDGKMLAFNALEPDRAVYLVPELGERFIDTDASLSGAHVSMLGFDPGGTQLWVRVSPDRGDADGTIRAYDLFKPADPDEPVQMTPAERNAARIYNAEYVNAARLDRDRQTIASTTEDGEVTVHFGQQDRTGVPLPDWGGFVLRVVVSDDATRAAVLYGDATVHIWDLQTGRRLSRHHLPGTPALDAVFLASGTLRLFQPGRPSGSDVEPNPSSWRGLGPFMDFRGRVVDLDTADATAVQLDVPDLSVNRGDAIDPATQIRVEPFWPEEVSDRSVVVASGARKAAAWLDSGIHVFVPDQVEPVQIFATDGIQFGISNELRFSDSGRLLLAGGGYRGPGTFTIWDTETGELLSGHVGTQSAVASVWFTSDETHVLIGIQGGGVSLFSIETLAEAHRNASEPPDPIWSMREATMPAILIADGTRLISGGSNKVEVFDTASGIRLAEYVLEGYAVPLRENDDGRVLIRFEDVLEAWDFSSIPKGNAFQVACALLPDHSWKGVLKGSAGQLGDEEICPDDYNPPAR